MKKPNPEFENFTSFMDKLAKVPHSELKAELDAERLSKQSPAPKKKGGQPKQTRAAMLVALAILCLPAITLAAKHNPVWQDAKLLSFDAQQGKDTGNTETNGKIKSDGTYSGTTTENDWSYVDYHVVLDDGKMLYFGTWRLVFRWQHTPHFTENKMVKFDLDGDNMTVVDDTGKEIKMKITKRRIKEP